MALRAKKPVVQDARFQAVVYANRGVGKTHFCCSFPDTYYIDTEGLEHYPQFVKMLDNNNSFIVRLNDLSEIIREIKVLLSTQHTFKTVVIDSITFPYHLLSIMEADRLAKNGKEGTEFSAHLAKAKRQVFELGMLLSRLDMNVLVTAHEKVKYEKAVEIGKASDVNDKIEYSLGTVINLRKFGDSTKAFIEKSRYAEIKSGESLDFNSGYETISERLGKSIFEKESKPVHLATREQIVEWCRLRDVLNVPEEVMQKWVINARATSVEQMSSDDIQKVIDLLLKKIAGKAE